MGVINITPNSFSDGGKYSSTNDLLIEFQQMLKWCDCIDIGAESTAPFNGAITEFEELERFEKLFYPVLLKLNDPEVTISIDTYHGNVFKEVACKIHKAWPQTKLIWNDISGKLDQEFKDTIANINFDFEYVFCHNLAPDRAQANNHQNFTTNEEIVPHLKDYFFDAEQVLKYSGIKYMFDPCFGFSKTRDQNLRLIKNFHHLAKDFPKHQWVYGVSRKSFLHLGSRDYQLADNVQTLIISELLEKVECNKLCFRVHEPHGIQSINLKNQLF